MESKELYRHLLGLAEPWTVERVELDTGQQRVDVYVEHASSTRFARPECARGFAAYDHSGERVWRHLDSCQFLTYLHAGPPRVSCPEHGAKRALLPWAEAGSRFTDLFEALAIERFDGIKQGNLKTGRAWALKESLRELWSYRGAGWAKRFWQRRYSWATHSRLPAMIGAAKLIARHLPNVLTYFKHRITNAVAEGLNSKIATLQKRAYGFRNREHFKIAVYFHCGGLDLYPASVTHGRAG